MTIQEILQRIEMLEHSDQPVGFQILDLHKLLAQKRREYRSTVPGLQESIAEMNRRLELLRSRTPIENHASDILIQQHLDNLKRLEAELAAKLGSSVPGDNAQFLPGTIV